MSATGSAARGYSLLELMVVMAIVVMIAASIPYAINRLVPARRLTQTTEKLVANLRSLQAEAISTGAPARLMLTREGYELVTKEGRQHIELSDETTLTIRGLDFVERDELILFAEGSSSGAVVTLTDVGRFTRIDVAMSTGRLRWNGRAQRL